MSNNDDRRHWHGLTGDRHEHLNVWTNGGAKGPASRAPWALTPEMMANLNARKGSDASTSSNNNTNTTAANPNQAGSPTLPTVNERRRSSASSGASGLFSNLHTQKRESGDANMAGRRASWNEQQSPTGFFGKLWDGYTRK